MSTNLSIAVSEKQTPAARVSIFHLQGDIDAQSSPQLQAKAQEAFEAGMRNLVLDLTQVSYVSSAGIRAMHHIFAMLRGDAPGESDEAMREGVRNGTFKSPHLKLLGPSRDVLEVLRTTGMDMYLAIYSSLEDALAAFAPK